MAAVPPLALRLVMEDAEEGFFLGTRRFPLRGFSLPMTVSTNEVTALVAASFVAAMFISAASAIASGTDEITPSFFLPIAISLPAPGKRQRWPHGPWRNKRIHLPLDASSSSAPPTSPPAKQSPPQLKTGTRVPTYWTGLRVLVIRPDPDTPSSASTSIKRRAPLQGPLSCQLGGVRLSIGAG